MRYTLFRVAAATLVVASCLWAQENEPALGGLKFRSIGPALTSGRISDFAVNPNNHSEYYVAVASGGVWKTTNAGTTFDPIFDDQGSYSIGCVSLDPNNANVVWVGTGENNNQRSVGYGDGVYRSTDGGKSWKNVGLENSEHIAKIIVHPEDGRVVYVAAQGPLWSAGGERGVYKTTDFGETWEAVLSISEHTGVTDLEMDPRDPDVLYAAAHQRRRRQWTLVAGGPESALYKTTDGGATWEKSQSGLPSVDIGRIGLALSPADPDVIYAIVEATLDKGGFFRSTNRGASWEKRSGYVSGSPQYYQEIYADLWNVDRVYSMDTRTMATDDGGATFRRLGQKHRHVDDHAFWMDPTDPNHYLVGGDGGIYESWDRGENWNFKRNLPVTQFYRISVSYEKPFYYVYGGTQDNYSLGAPSQTLAVSGVVNADWFVTNGGDGFESQVDPENPDIIYAQSQHAGLVRYDRETGEAKFIKPLERPGEDPLNWNWDSPLLISPHKAERLYYAANKVFVSEDRGDSWTPISGDLTRMIDRDKLEVMGRVWEPDAVFKHLGTTIWGTLISLDESPLVEGLLYVGADDGNMSVSRDGGGTWQSSASFPGVPDMTPVRALVASRHDPDVVYAAFDNHKAGDFTPYLLKSGDRGASWTSIVGNLPDKGTIYAVREDHVDPDLLFVGTEFGVWFTTDGGAEWRELGAGLPTIAVYDLEIQREENDLVLGTFGRGVYILDDYSPLREIGDGALVAADAHLFEVPDALKYIPSRPVGYSAKQYQGESYFTTENPPVGAVFTYYLDESIKTLEERRHEREKKARENGQTADVADVEELREEAREETPYLVFEIADATGAPVRTITAKAAAGVNRVVWDLRYPAKTPVKLGGGEFDPFVEQERGMLVPENEYTVTMGRSIDGSFETLSEPKSFSVYSLGTSALEPVAKETTDKFRREYETLRMKVAGAQETLANLQTRVESARQALLETPAADEALKADVLALDDRLYELDVTLNGDALKRKRAHATNQSIADRVGYIGWSEWNSTYGPTAHERQVLADAERQLETLVADMTSIMNGELKSIESKLAELDAPWTPNRTEQFK